METPLLELVDVEKAFPGVRALWPCDLTMRPGEIVGLIGENGAGKSTLIKVISGMIPPDRGIMRWNGEQVAWGGAGAALARGIATIHQELAYCGRLTVAENLCLGESWPRLRWGRVDWKALHRQARESLNAFGMQVPTHWSLARLSTAQKQEVAIAQALRRNARLLILDEPTASLSTPEVERLFKQLRHLRSRGVSLLYVSHRLDEILDLTDRILVLRDGQVVGRHPTKEVDLRQLVREMVGREVDVHTPRATRREPIGPLLELQDVCSSGEFEHISLQVGQGEVVGLAGLVGSGRSALARSIYGLQPLTQGSMHLRGKPWCPQDAAEALQEGVVYVPEERQRQALVPEHSVYESISVGFSDRWTRWGMILAKRVADRVRELLRVCRIITIGSGAAVGTLSGGNQQKTLLARWLGRDPQLLLLDEPTRGVDIGAKAEIHALIGQLATEGKGILLISSDLPEVIHLSDRVLVMRDGRLAAELSEAQRTEHGLLVAVSGGDP